MEEDVLKLGGNIELSGFNNLDRGLMTVLKKIVGNHVKLMNEKCSKFEKLRLDIKEGYELNAELINDGQSICASISDNNLFVAVDMVLKEVRDKI